MSSSGAGLTALVVDDELPALSDLGYLLGRDERVGEVITASSGTEALQVLDGRDVDVVFSDISMPGLDGIAATSEILHRNPIARIVLITVSNDPVLVQRGLDAGALGYVLKRTAGEELIPAIRSALRGERHVSPAQHAAVT